MIESIPYISPSMFYYWNKCPLKAVFYYKFKNTQFFPKHPDADLGSIIHSFYENKYKWGITDEEKFNNKWKELINDLNNKYLDNHLQFMYFPVQWHSSFYAVKKQLLLTQLFKYSKQEHIRSKIKKEIWIEDKEKVIAGKIDLLIYDDTGKVLEIVDYKTGKIFEKKDSKLSIKNVYKFQLALYAKAVMDMQNKKPSLSLINLSGKKFNIECSYNFIEQTYSDTKSLKNKINTALINGDLKKLANPDTDNCYKCNYRKVCEAYKRKFINFPVKKNIDIKGRVNNIHANSFEVETETGEFKIVNLDKIKITNNQLVTIYNLYFPKEENKLLYTQKNTVIEYE